MLHLAEASGLAHVGPAHLAIHPQHGPWFGLRAVIVLDANVPNGDRLAMTNRNAALAPSAKPRK